MSKQVIATADAPRSPLFSQGIRVGPTIYVSGMTGTDVTTMQLSGPSIEEQTRQALKNCDAILRAAGSSMAKVVNATFILRYSEDFAGMNEEWVRWFPTDPPARQGAKHPLEVEGLRISIALIAEA